MTDLGFNGKGNPFLQVWVMLRELYALQAVLDALFLWLGCNVVLAAGDLDLLVPG